MAAPAARLLTPGASGFSRGLKGKRESTPAVHRKRAEYGNGPNAAGGRIVGRSDPSRDAGGGAKEKGRAQDADCVLAQPWCRWWDSNPHGGLAQRILSPSRLPIPSHRRAWGIIAYLSGERQYPAGVFSGRGRYPLSPSRPRKPRDSAPARHTRRPLGTSTQYALAPHRSKSAP